MHRQIYLINLGLICIIFLLGINVYRIWCSIIKKEWKYPFYVTEIISKKEVPAEEGPDTKPALYTYDVIADKNLFRPQRTEWLPPLPEEEKGY